MREFSVPATTEVGPDEALPDLLAKNVAEVGDQTGFRVQRGGEWQDVTWKEFGDQVAGVAKGLIASGVAAGDRVALQAKTRYEWAVIDFAIWTAGAVDRADLRDLQRRPGGLDPVRLRRDRGDRRARRARERRRVRARPGAGPASRSTSSRTTRSAR